MALVPGQPRLDPNGPYGIINGRRCKVQRHYYAVEHRHPTPKNTLALSAVVLVLELRPLIVDDTADSVPATNADHELEPTTLFEEFELSDPFGGFVDQQASLTGSASRRPLRRAVVQTSPTELDRKSKPPTIKKVYRFGRSPPPYFARNAQASGRTQRRAATSNTRPTGLARRVEHQ